MSKKAIMISVKPKWVAKILNGEKTIEIRKTMPKCDLPIDVYIYCTKDKKDYLCKPNEWGMPFPKTYALGGKCCKNYNGKVVAKFALNKVERFEWDSCGRDNNGYWLDNGERFDLKHTCLTYEELFAYVKSDVGYAWHISNLEIFDKPKELSEFKHWVFYKKCEKCPYGKNDYDYGLCSQCCEIKPLTKAPQSWQFIEVE